MGSSYVERLLQLTFRSDTAPQRAACATRETRQSEHHYSTSSCLALGRAPALPTVGDLVHFEIPIGPGYSCRLTLRQRPAPLRSSFLSWLSHPDLPWPSTFQIRVDDEATHYEFHEWPPPAHGHAHQYSDLADQDYSQEQIDLDTVILAYNLNTECSTQKAGEQ
jgi:hypothetical protein